MVRFRCVINIFLLNIDVYFIKTGLVRCLKLFKHSQLVQGSVLLVLDDPPKVYQRKFDKIFVLYTEHVDFLVYSSFFGREF